MSDEKLTEAFQVSYSDFLARVKSDISNGEDINIQDVLETFEERLQNKLVDFVEELNLEQVKEELEDLIVLNESKTKWKQREQREELAFECCLDDLLVHFQLGIKRQIKKGDLDLDSIDIESEFSDWVEGMTQCFINSVVWEDIEENIRANNF